VGSTFFFKSPGLDIPTDKYAVMNRKINPKTMIFQAGLKAFSDWKNKMSRRVEKRSKDGMNT